MESTKKYYYALDYLRVLSCIAVLLYHLHVLKGGYLAVCCFFVLSGYLSCVSAFHKNHFSIWEYYKRLFTKIYFPLLLTVFLTLFVVFFCSQYTWLNLKPETTSVLLGYNNFWQLGANLDYFARHLDSPFMHLWYISILLQFDLLFPFFYQILRKIGDHIHKMIPCLLLLVVSIGSAWYFYQMSGTQDIMVVYYHTFTRMFSLFWGMTLGFIQFYYYPLILKNMKHSLIAYGLFGGYFVLLVWLFLTIDASAPSWAVAMLIVSLITCRMIDYSTLMVNKLAGVGNRIVHWFSDRSYCIYLVQYPIIYFLQAFSMSDSVRILSILLGVLVVGSVFHFSISSRPHARTRMHAAMAIILCVICVPGVYCYAQTKDHTAEMKRLKEELAANEEVIQQKQKEYADRLQQEQEDWFSVLEDLENGEQEIQKIVSELSVVGVGDSIMLGAVDNLYKQFPNGYFDAKVSRSIWVANGILEELEDSNLLGNPVILNLGANGDCSSSCKEEILQTCGDRDVFWITVTNDKDVHVNSKLKELSKSHSNLHIIDWETASQGHSKYFYADGIHLTPEGRKAYTNLIYQSIYQVYLDRYQQKKEEIIHHHEEELKNKITFYGNDVLVNIFNELHQEYQQAQFIVRQDFTWQDLQQELQKAADSNTLTYRLVVAFDSQVPRLEQEIQTVFQLCQENELYVVAMTEEDEILLETLGISSLHIIPFYEEIQQHKEYVRVDKIHLTEEGNRALYQMLIKEIED